MLLHQCPISCPGTQPFPTTAWSTWNLPPRTFVLCSVGPRPSLPRPPACLVMGAAQASSRAAQLAQPFPWAASRPPHTQHVSMEDAGLPSLVCPPGSALRCQCRLCMPASLWPPPPLITVRRSPPSSVLRVEPGAASSFPLSRCCRTGSLGPVPRLQCLCPCPTPTGPSISGDSHAGS